MVSNEDRFARAIVETIYSSLSELSLAHSHPHGATTSPRPFRSEPPTPGLELPGDRSAPGPPTMRALLRSNGLRGRHAQEAIGADTLFVDLSSHARGDRQEVGT
jgi:hypothetical protein